MRRKSLFLLLSAPLLFALLLVQLGSAQAARPLQAVTPTATPRAAATAGSAQPGQPAVDAGVPLSQPLSIRIRQQVPITVALLLLRPVTATLSPTGTLEFTGLQPITDTVSRSSVAGLLGSEATTTTTPLAAATAVTALTPITGATLITGLLPITGALPLTAELPLTIPAATTEITLTAAATSVTGVPVTTLAVPTNTAGAGDLRALTGTLPVTTPAVLLAAGDVLTTAPDIFTGVGITMDLDLEFTITDTLTSTVPARLTLRFAGMPTVTLPVSIVVSAPTTAVVSVQPVAPVPTEALTLTEIVTLTPVLTGTPVATRTATPTPTATPFDISALTIITVTAPVTANIRSAASIDAAVVRVVPPGSVLSVAAQNAAGDWLLLQEGNWISVLVFGAAPAGLPTATDELLAGLRELAANATPTPTPLPPTPTPTPTATPTLPPFTPVNVTTTTNANLRAGPGTDYALVGSTTVGQSVTVTARDATGGWLLLDSGSWIAVQLVNGLPAVATIPVFDPNAPPTATPVLIPTATSPAATTPLTPTLPLTGTPVAPLLPTATPSAPAAPTATPTPQTLSVEENVYLVEFDNILANYQRALTAIDRLVDTASGNTAVFADQQWLTDMNTAIQLLRNAGASVQRLTPPERFVAAHNSLTAAAANYNSAADLLAAGVQASDPAQFNQAFQATALGDASIAQAQAALSTFRP